MAIVESQKVNMKWNGKHKSYYESILDTAGKQKYKYTKQHDVFIIDVEDLPRGSQTLVEVICDYCEKKFKKAYVNLNIEREKSEIKKDCCKECSPTKLREKYGTLDELDFEETEFSSKIYTKEFLKNEFFRYVEEFGQFPKKVDIDGQDGYPSAFSYSTHWKNWNDFLKDIGVLGDYGWYAKDQETILKMYPNPDYSFKEINSKLLIKRSVYDVQNLAKKMNLSYRELLIKRNYDLSNMGNKEIFIKTLFDLEYDTGKCPTAIDYDAYTKLNKLPSRKLHEKKTGLKFSEICMEIFSETNKETKSNEELINELRNLKLKLGRTPKANELKIHGLPEKKAYMRRFNMTYQELIQSLGWELGTPKLSFKTDEEMLADYDSLYRELERLPNNIDLQECPYTSSYTNYRMKFGSLANVWSILELPFERNQDFSAGFVGTNKKGEICRSNSEIQISNLLIDNNIEYQSEVRYSDLESNLNKKWIMDWYLPEKLIYVEYFGMYQETQLKRNTRIGKYSRKVKQKIDYCKNNNIDLVAIFPIDLINEFSGLREKFKLLNVELVV